MFDTRHCQSPHHNVPSFIMHKKGQQKTALSCRGCALFIIRGGGVTGAKNTSRTDVAVACGFLQKKMISLWPTATHFFILRVVEDIIKANLSVCACLADNDDEKCNSELSNYYHYYAYVKKQERGAY